MTTKFQHAVNTSINRPKRTGSRAFKVLDVADAKKQVEVADSIIRHDDQLEELITEALDTVCIDTGQADADATYTMQYDFWPEGDEPIRLPVRPVSAITTVKYYDTATAQQTLSAALYRFDNHRGWPVVWRADLDVDWPDLDTRRPEAIEITFQAGHLTLAAIKADAVWIRQAALFRLALLWHDRGLGQVDYDKSMRVYDSIIARRRSTLYL